MGVRDESMDIIVGTEGGVVKARDFKRYGSTDERWNEANANAASRSGDTESNNSVLP